MQLDADQCYAAVRSRDVRFDGRFFTGVLSTGIFCRPICPARTPRRDRVRFFPSAAAALHAGFRPCRRCRPDKAASWDEVDGSEQLVRRAVHLIDRGALDDRGVEDLAERLSVSPRHLRRLFVDVVGSTPGQVAAARRVLLANQLLLDTELPMAAVAFAAGFGSVRRFNEAIRAAHDATPTQVRRARARTASSTLDATTPMSVTTELPLRTTGGLAALLRFLRARTLPGLEDIDGLTYRRRIPTGSVVLDAGPSLTVTVATDELTRLQPLRSAARALVDADADLATIDAHIAAASPTVEELVDRLPDRRVPGAWDPWETMVRVVLGQQVTVAAANRLAGRFVHDDGTFAGPAEVAAGDLVDTLGMPAARKRALRALAAAAEGGNLDPAAPLATVRSHLRSLPGIGEWTVEMIALRALRDPDAFPSGDLGIRRGLKTCELTPRDVAATRPFRSHLAIRLWEVAA